MDYRYIFKYNKKGQLTIYVEKDKKDDVLSFFKINYKNNTVIRYDKNEKRKSFVKYSENINVLQRFEAGESWITIIKQKLPKQPFEKKKKDAPYSSTHAEYRFSHYYHKETPTVTNVIQEFSNELNKINFSAIPPRREKEITILKGNPTNFSLNRCLVNRYMNVLDISNKYKEYPHITLKPINFF